MIKLAKRWRSGSALSALSLTLKRTSIHAVCVKGRETRPARRRRQLWETSWGSNAPPAPWSTSLTARLVLLAMVFFTNLCRRSFSTIKTYFQMINPQSSAYISEQLWVLLTGQKWNGAVLLQPPWPTGKYLLFMQRSSSKSHICSFTRLTPEEVAALQVQLINDWIMGDDALCLDQILQGREWSIVPPVYTYCRFCQVIFSLWRMPPSNREWCRIPVIVMYTHCRFCVIVPP